MCVQMLSVCVNVCMHECVHMQPHAAAAKMQNQHTLTIGCVCECGFV